MELHEWGIIIVDSIVVPALIGAYVRFRQIERVSEFNEQQVLDLKVNITKLENKVETLEANRSKDLVSFSDILGKINVTLAKLETTMHHLNDTLGSVKDQQDNLTDRMDDLYRKL